VSFLTYLPGRVRVWTEHPNFPYKAIAYWYDSLNGPFKVGQLEIYKMSDDRSKIERIPSKEWPVNGVD
jgi:hypothetical protein